MVTLQPVVICAGLFDSRGCCDRMETPPRVLTTYEVAMFIEDSGTAYMNGQEHVIRKDWVLLGRPGDVRWNKLHFRCQTVHFSTEVPALVQLLEALPQFFKPTDSKLVLAKFRAVGESFCSGEKFSEVATAAGMCELLWLLYQNSAEKNVTVGRNPVRKAVRLIRGQYDEHISVEQMAQVCGLSTSHFHKVFVETMGTTPNRYLTLTRLSAAKTLLLAGNQSVAQIAECCGFSSQAYFCQCLKKTTGLSPKQFCRQTGQLDEI